MAGDTLTLAGAGFPGVEPGLNCDLVLVGGLRFGTRCEDKDAEARGSKAKGGARGKGRLGPGPIDLMCAI